MSQKRSSRPQQSKESRGSSRGLFSGLYFSAGGPGDVIGQAAARRAGVNPPRVPTFDEYWSQTLTEANSSYTVRGCKGPRAEEDAQLSQDSDGGMPPPARGGGGGGGSKSHRQHHHGGHHQPAPVAPSFYSSATSARATARGAHGAAAAAAPSCDKLGCIGISQFDLGILSRFTHDLTNECQVGRWVAWWRGGRVGGCDAERGRVRCGACACVQKPFEPRVNRRSSTMTTQRVLFFFLFFSLLTAPLALSVEP